MIPKTYAIYSTVTAQVKCGLDTYEQHYLQIIIGYFCASAPYGFQVSSEHYAVVKYKPTGKSSSQSNHEKNHNIGFGDEL